MMMNSLTYHEQKQHGTLAFPFEYHYIDVHHPRYSMPFHWHKEWELIHVIEGSFQVHADDMVYTACTGDTLLIRDGMLHGGTPDSCVYECFLFDLHDLFRNMEAVKKYLRPVYRQQILPDIYYPAGMIPEIDEAIKILSRTYSQDRTMNNPLELIVYSCISRCFSAILCAHAYTENTSAAGDNTHKLDLIRSVLEYIDQQYASPITLDQLAAAAGMNPRYFCRFFRSITYQTPMEYVNMYRIERACEMLSSTSLPVTTICMECGFNDSSNFIKVFRKYKGMTPNQYRKR